MCRHYLGYMKCPQCQKLFRPAHLLDFYHKIVAPVAEVAQDPVTPIPWYRHCGMNPFYRPRNWHFHHPVRRHANQKPPAVLLPPIEKYLSFSHAQTDCDECLVKQGGPSVVDVEARRYLRDLNWPLDVGLEKDHRAFLFHTAKTRIFRHDNNLEPQEIVGKARFKLKVHEFKTRKVNAMKRCIEKLPGCKKKFAKEPIPWTWNAV